MNKDAYFKYRSLRIRSGAVERRLGMWVQGWLVLTTGVLGARACTAAVTWTHFVIAASVLVLMMWVLIMVTVYKNRTERMMRMAEDGRL